MNKVTILGLFMLLGILVGFAVHQPMAGTITGTVIGAALYLFIPEKKHKSVRRTGKA